MLKKQMEDAGLLPTPSQAELTKRAKMLDPRDNTPGIRKNRKKTWASFKQLRGVTIKNIKKQK